MDFLANDIKNLITKGNILAELGHYNEASSYYFRILDIDPSNQEALVNLGNTLIELKKYPDAIICYDSLLKMDYKNSLAWQQKGYLLLQMNRTEEAISCLDFSIQNNPDNYNALFLLASTFMKLEKYNEAILCYDKCLETCDPDVYFKVLWSKGLAFDKLSSTTTSCVESAQTSSGYPNYYESVGHIQDFKNDEVKDPEGVSRQLSQEEGINSSVETDEEPDYSYDYSQEPDEESDDEYYERIDREMQDLGDYNLMQYYRTCENSEDDYELEY
jgi:tetratricopeptide (TPR) repeat protein